MGLYDMGLGMADAANSAYTNANPTAGAGGWMGATSQGISAVGELFNMWQSRKNYKLAKEAFKFNKELSTVNLNNQAKLTNERLETRQNSRQRTNPYAEKTDTFMAKYKVSGIGG
jgi:hypothetical protein